MSSLPGKMFTFPKESDIDHVRLLTKSENYSSVTICLSFALHIGKYHGCSLFSMATPTSTNDFLLFKESNGAMQLPVRYVGSAFTGLPGKQNMWMGHSATGLSQVWINGKPSARKLGYTAGSVVNGKPIIILGQEQDAYCGTFKKREGITFLK
ncbi:unnamed protein product [Oncorhynchus mykiss]|uniref:Pentraxin family member n=1 Tax=Oncorhynchus mykiss TaxID=8022 RepID=A0A060VUM9_ONCMY|nr:unnamed protein product [Oncorhynchus mykiss]